MQWKIQLVIEKLSKEMYLSQWRDGDEFKKRNWGNQSLCKKKVKTETWNILK